MKREPRTAPPPLQRRADLDLVQQVREYHLITPLFGGGVTPQQPDAVTVVRTAELRGQLRFWWRAMHGGQFGDDLVRLREREGQMWGLAAQIDPRDQRPLGGPSQIQVALLAWEQGSPDVPYVVGGSRDRPRITARPGTTVPDYAAFPLQPKREDQMPNMALPPVYRDVRFTVQLTFPAVLQPELEAALWAWETFGGVGARTRRGFGALRLVAINRQPPADLPRATEQDCRQWIGHKLGRYQTGTHWHDGLPHLSAATRFHLLPDSRGDAIRIWNDLLRSLKQFRQQRRNKAAFRADQYGHSDWPEPNAIRRAAGQSARGPHADRTIDTFPRAQFGLPIVFHMPHDPALPETTLQGATEGKRRLASPLILKPIACRDGTAIGLALILDGARLPDTLELHGLNKDPRDAQLTTAEAGQTPPLKGNPDVLQAFLDMLSKD